MERSSEIDSKPAALVSCFGKAEPSLLDLRKAIPGPEHRFINVPCPSLVSKENDTLNHLIVELAILGLLAVEQQERIDEQRQVGDQRNVEGALFFQDARINSESISEVSAHPSTIPKLQTSKSCSFRARPFRLVSRREARPQLTESHFGTFTV